MMALATNFKPVRETAAERQARRRRPVGYRQPVVRDNASNSPELALAKGPSRHDEQTADREHTNAVIKVVRSAVFGASSLCAVCGDTERQSGAKHWKAAHELHEDPSRAKTKGLPAEQRFNEQICMRICVGCHGQYGVRVRCLPLTVEGFAGPYDVQHKNGVGEWETIFTVDKQRGLRA